MKERTYIAIDLKSFYASVECRERGLDPMDTALRARPRQKNINFIKNLKKSACPRQKNINFIKVL